MKRIQHLGVIEGGKQPEPTRRTPEEQAKHDQKVRRIVKAIPTLLVASGLALGIAKGQKSEATGSMGQPNKSTPVEEWAGAPAYKALLGVNESNTADNLPAMPQQEANGPIYALPAAKTKEVVVQPGDDPAMVAQRANQAEGLSYINPDYNQSQQVAIVQSIGMPDPGEKVRVPVPGETDTHLEAMPRPLTMEQEQVNRGPDVHTR